MKHQLRAIATIAVSGQSGEIIGRGEYANGSPPSYLLRYRDAQGNAREDWISEDALRDPQQPAQTDAHVAIGATRFSDGRIQTAESLTEALALEQPGIRA